MKKAIWLDMDGTFVDLYAVEGWLDALRAESAMPYEVAAPLFAMANFARALHNAQANGFEINIVSWASKGASPSYEKAIANAKREWLARHLPSVQFDRIDILPYGMPKGEGREGILIDDEIRNRLKWHNGMAFDAVAVVKLINTIVAIY